MKHLSLVLTALTLASDFNVIAASMPNENYLDQRDADIIIRDRTPKPCPPCPTGATGPNGSNGATGPDGVGGNNVDHLFNFGHTGALQTGFIAFEPVDAVRLGTSVVQTSSETFNISEPGDYLVQVVIQVASGTAPGITIQAVINAVPQPSAVNPYVVTYLGGAQLKLNQIISITPSEFTPTVTLSIMISDPALTAPTAFFAENTSITIEKISPYPGT